MAAGPGRGMRRDGDATHGLQRPRQTRALGAERVRPSEVTLVFDGADCPYFHRIFNCIFTLFLTGRLLRTTGPAVPHT